MFRKCIHTSLDFFFLHDTHALTHDYRDTHAHRHLCKHMQTHTCGTHTHTHTHTLSLSLSLSLSLYNNNNNNRIQRRYSRSFTISSQRRELSPTRMLKWPERNRVQITCNTSSAYFVQVSCYVPLGTKGQLSY